MDAQLERLTQVLAGRYAIEREIGRGGMATVYLAADLKHHRKVAVKVLDPELGAAVGADRFLREIEIAANLTHPHILGIHDSGGADGLLYFVMPFVEGESLRDRLDREKQLPIDEAIRITRAVAEALHFAHERGVIHRDVKPANILLEAGHAILADFGIAKAAQDAGEERLTLTGMSVGTPAYMSPEQATGTGELDGRADIYSLACVLYEMLGGETPFPGTTPQAILARKVAEEAPPLRTLRATVSAPLEQVVLKALARVPADRYTTAAQFSEALQRASAVRPAPLALHSEALTPVRVAGLYLAGSLVVLGLVHLLVIQVGLPGWVSAGALVLLTLGLPLATLTAHMERRRAAFRRAGVAERASYDGARGWFTWPRTAMGGGLAFAGLTLVTTLYMAMRLLGIGPVATLVAAGVLGEREPVILAEFTDHTGDSTLAVAVTEAFRIDLGQSPSVTLTPPGDVRFELQLMRRDPATPLDLHLAQEIALRRGIKAVVTGEISAVGGGYLLSVRLVGPESGEDLAAFRETAAGEAEVIPAIDRLSKRLRGRIGESLRTLRAAPPLPASTTASLPALRKYLEAWQALPEGDERRAVELFREAIALDTTFAMAYRSLAIRLGNLGRGRSEEAMTAMAKAFQHREGLPPWERYLIEGSYYMSVTGEPRRAIDAYASLLDMYPRNNPALTNITLMYHHLRDHERAVESGQRALELSPRSVNLHGNQIGLLVFADRLAEAEAVLERVNRLSANHVRIGELAAQIHIARGDLDGAESLLRKAREDSRDMPEWHWTYSIRLVWLLALRGRYAEATEYVRQLANEAQQLGWPTQYLEAVAGLAQVDAALGGDSAAAVAGLEAALERYPLDSLGPLDRPYVDLAHGFARAGQAGRARALLAEFDQEVREDWRRPSLPARYGALGLIALAEGRPRDAVEAFQEADVGPCLLCALPGLGRAYDLMGDADSAIAVFERYVADSRIRLRPVWSLRWMELSPWMDLAPTCKRLGELYGQHGNAERATHYYNRFVELWRDADPALQPQVEDVKGRIAWLAGEP